MDPRPMTVAGYARVSTENQLENYSIEEQTGRLRAFCAAKSWTLGELYVDGGYSGGNTDRPALRVDLRDWYWFFGGAAWTPWWCASWTGSPAPRRTP